MRAVLATAGFVGGAALSTGVALAIQSRSEGGLPAVQQRPEFANHMSFGSVGLAGLTGAGTYGVWADGSGRSYGPGVSALLGASVGAAAGAYLVAPSIRRWMSEH